MNFKHLAKFVEITNFFGGELTHIGATPRLDTDETFGFQTIQRLAHRRLADSQLGRERLFGEPRQLSECSVQHILLDAAIGKLSQVWDFRQLDHDRCWSRGFYTKRVSCLPVRV